MGPNENDQQDNSSQDDGQQPKINPKWKNLLDVIPDSLHGIVTPHLQEWDRGVTQRFQEIREEYNPYKPFVENKIDPQEIQNAINLAQAIQNDPASVVQRMVDHFNLEQYKQQQLSTDPDEVPDLDDLGGLDVEALKKHPAFKDVFKKVEETQQWIQQQQQLTQQEQATAQIQDYLEELHEKFDDETSGFAFDDGYVTTMLANGVDGEQAVQMYKDLITQARTGFVPATETPNPSTPPVVMGGAGNTGAGVPNRDVKMGSLKESELNSLVVQVLQQASQDPNN